MSKRISTFDEFTIITFTDHVSAFNGLKRADIKGKGMMNNKISAYIFKYLSNQGVSTQYIETIDDVSQRVLNVRMIPIEVIIRNKAAGPWIESLGLGHRETLTKTILEYRYKKEGLKDPLINSTHINALKLCKEDELKLIHDMALGINKELMYLFKQVSIDLIDLKLEFGFDSNNDIVLADSITPDTMRLWDIDTGDSLDKDVFRKDLGKLDKAYEIILNRLEACV